jgi:phosphoribosylglycinamide formyltransferase 1
MAVSPTRLLVLASGRGSNFEAILLATRKGDIANAEVVGLVCPSPSTPALERARRLGVPTAVYETTPQDPKGNKALRTLIDQFHPDYVCCAGFLKIIDAGLVAAYPNRILNVHPSLLPSFKGLHAQRQALNYGVRWTGCTIHFVTEGLDDGPILAQAVLEVLPEDTEASLSQRLSAVEHTTYVHALRRLCTEKYLIEGRRVAWQGSHPK